LSIADFAQKNKRETLLIAQVLSFSEFFSIIVLFFSIIDSSQTCALESRWAFACDTLFGALVADLDAKFMDQFTKVRC
jgi:hypothetical protein